MSFRRRALLPLILLFAVGPAFGAEPAPAAQERMKKDLFFLAGDECQGRGVGTPGIDKAADHIAKAFRDAGLKPGGTDGYFQPFVIYGTAKLGTPNTARLTGPGGQKLDLKYAAQFMPTGLSAPGKAAAGLVFAGYGITSDKLKYDDYAGLDAKGKLVLVLRRTPKADQKDNPFDADDEVQHAALVTKVENAERHGAAGVLLVNDRTYGKGKDDLLDYRRNPFESAKLPVVHVKRAVLDLLLSAQGRSLAAIEDAIDKDLKPQSLALADWSADLQVTVVRPEIPCKNVVGVLEGSGPLADETVVIGAHYDHLGTSSNGSLGGRAAEGQVHYGADDNASGTTGLIELARRFGAVKDRKGRRLVFVAFSGEERGLYGSKHYASEPPFPLDKTAVMLNMDMIGRSAPVDADGAKKDRLVVNGLGTAAGFEKLVDDANAKYDFRLFKVQSGSGPSDHDSFYRKRVPVLFVYTGTHRDYHRPSDTPDKINYPTMAKVVDLMEGLAAHFAAAERPKFLATKGGWSDPTEERRASPRAGMPKLGIMPGNYEAEDEGVLVDDVSPGGAAEKGGIKAKDVIVEIAGKPVKNIQQYMTVLGGQKAGQEIEVVVVRGKKRVPLKVTPRE